MRSIRRRTRRRRGGGGRIRRRRNHQYHTAEICYFRVRMYSSWFLQPIAIIINLLCPYTVQQNSTYPDAGYPDRLGASSKFVENSTKPTCLEITGYRIKYSTV